MSLTACVAICVAVVCAIIIACAIHSVARALREVAESDRLISIGLNRQASMFDDIRRYGIEQDKNKTPGEKVWAAVQRGANPTTFGIGGNSQGDFLLKVQHRIMGNLHKDNT